MKIIKILFILVFLVGCATVYNPATQRNEYYFIDDDAEVTIGRNIARNILAKEKVISDEEMLSSLRDMGARIVKVSDRDYLNYEFYIVDDETSNAFAVPGGFIFVNKGLIERSSEDELAFVLSHEIGHVAARHSVKKLQASLGLSLLLSIALRSPNLELVRSGVNVVYNVVALGYSRQDELLADSLGVKYSYKAGYNPEAAISLFNKLKEESKHVQTLVFLRSHPLPEDRISNIEKKIAEIKGLPLN